MQSIDLLAIAAHPDDVELACAGTMLMAKRAGKRTGIIDLTRGELSTRGTLETRQQETEAATKILGLDYRVNLGMSDGNIELSQENQRSLIVQIRKTRPTILLMPSKFERHPDHEAAAELAHRVAFYAGLVKIETIDDDGSKQVPHRPLLVLHYMQAYPFEPKIIVDVTPVFEERMRAMEAYGSQFRSKDEGGRMKDDGKNEKDVPSSLRQAQGRHLNPHPSSFSNETFLSQTGFFEWLRSRASAYGMRIGVRYAEPFWTPEDIGTKDIFSVVTKTIA
jgi:bacillithiol biosynthesis deacetylase BshB1